MTDKMNLQQVADWISGAMLWGDGSTKVTRVHTDTRTVRPGDPIELIAVADAHHPRDLQNAT